MRAQAPVPAADGREGRARRPAASPSRGSRAGRIFAFCGIATPESFEKFLRDLGALLVGRERFLDHYRYTPEDLEELYDAAERERAECLVTTEKDAVRISDAAGSPLPVYYLRLEIEIIRGAADFDEAVGRICFPQNALAGAPPAGRYWPNPMIIDPRFTQLADGLTGFSTALKKGERVLIDAFDVPDAMVIALVRSARARGALPYVQIHRARVVRELALGAEQAQYEALAEIELARMRQMDAYIALRGLGQHLRGGGRALAAGAAGQPAHEARHRPPREQDKVGRAQVADVGHGAAGLDEHRGLRGLLLPGLHARLLPDEARDEGARAT